MPADRALVPAERGVVRSVAEVLGVSRWRPIGESSVRFALQASTGVLPERRWLKERLDTSGGGRVADCGITRGVKSFGERGPACLNGTEAYASSMAASKSASSSLPKVKNVSASSCWIILLPGALAERSCRGGLPGMVAKGW